MTDLEPAGFDRLRVLFESAQSLSGDERDALLADECDDDPDLRASVEAMLAADRDPAFLERPDELSLECSARAALPEHIDRFEVLGVLGEGGSSVVLRARQLEPIRRTVALKVLRAARIDERARRRFQAEGDLLASLTHSGIAQIHDAGESEDGELYLAMELVEGTPMTTWCDSRGLNIDERLRLFLSVVEAVQYAHQKGVVHRDIKAAHVLVKGESDGTAVKLIDFGIARSIEGSGPRVHSTTWDGTILGTPSSMSPEQASGGAVDTRTDVYGLGVLVFELVTGTLPHDPATMAELPVDEVLRTIREVEPRSLVEAARDAPGGVDACAKARALSRRSLERRLRGDLAWIVARALALDPADRYATAAALGEDVERLLSDVPVTARASRPGYLVSRFVRRHRTGVAFATLGGLGVLATILGLAWTLDTVRRARDDARSNESEAAEQREVAIRREYAARIAAAGAAWEAGDAVRARSHLASAPASHRGWEWRHIASQLDGSLSLVEFDSLLIDAHWVTPERLFVLHRGRGVLLDVATRRTIAELPSESGELDEVIAGPTPESLIIDRRNRIDLLDLTSMSSIRTVHVATSDVRAMCLAPDHRWLLTTENSGAVRMHDVEGIEPSRVLFELPWIVRSPAFLAGGARILLGGADGVLELRGRGSGQRIASWTLGAEEIKALVVTEDESSAIIGIGTRVLRVDLENGAVVASCDAGVEVRDLAFAPGGGSLYVCGGWTRGRLLRLDATTLEIDQRLLGHKTGVQCIACPPGPVATSVGTVVLASGDGEGRLRFWSDEQKRSVRRLAAGYGATSLCCSSAGDLVITVDSSGCAHVRNAATLESVDEFQFGEGVYACTVVGDDLIAVGAKLHAASLETGARATGPALTGVVTELAVSPCGTWLAGAAPIHDRVFLWSLPDLAPVWEGVSKHPTDVVYDRFSQRFVILSDATIAQSLDPSQPSLAPFSGAHATAAGAARSGEEFGRAYITVDNTLYLCASPETPVRSAVEGFAASVALLHDGNRVFVGGNDDLLRVLDEDGRELLVLDDAPKPVSHLAIGAGERVFGLSRFPGSPSYLIAWEAPPNARLP